MTEADIRNKLWELSKSVGPEVSNIARVIEVNEDEALCQLEDEDGQLIPDVRLRPVLTGKKSFIQIPKVGSLVLAIRIEDTDEWMIIASDEIEKVAWYVGETSIELTDKVHIEAGGENLADLIERLFDAILRMRFTTNSGPTIRLINQQEFKKLKSDFEKLLK